MKSMNESRQNFVLTDRLCKTIIRNVRFRATKQYTSVFSSNGTGIMPSDLTLTVKDPVILLKCIWQALTNLAWASFRFRETDYFRSANPY